MRPRARRLLVVVVLTLVSLYYGRFHFFFYFLAALGAVNLFFLIRGMVRRRKRLPGEEDYP